MTQQYTPAQLEAWAGCTAKYPEPITQEMWIERVALFAEAKQHAPALARLVLEKDAEIAKLKRVLELASAAIDSAYMQSDAEWRGHDKVAGKHSNIVRTGRSAIRQAMKETSDDHD